MHAHRLSLIASVALLTACAGGDGERGDDTTFTTTTPTTGEDTGDPMVCVPGAQSSCACPGGGDGVQACNAEGTGLGECECGGVSDSADSTGPSGTTAEPTTGEPDPCGDLTCAEDETCDTCPEDCGECVPCTSAPSCEGAQVPPVIDMHADALDDIQMLYVPPDQALAKIAAIVEEGRPGLRVIVAALDQPLPGEHPFVSAVRNALAAEPRATAALRRELARAGIDDASMWRAAHPEPRPTANPTGAAELAASPAVAHGGVAQPCENPRLRIRVAQLDVPEEYDDVTNDEIYCLIAAEGTESSELRLTPVTAPIDEGGSHAFALAEGVVWGQQDLSAPKGNLALTYNCIESDDLSIYNGLIDAIGDAAEQAGGVAGDSGWVFDAVGIFSDLLPSVLSLDGDDQLFNAFQIIPEDMHLSLTQGAYWMVRRSYEGGAFESNWDWQLRMEIWGCHDNGQ